MKKVVLVIFGGNSPEYKVSCHSAAGIYNNIDRENFDAIFLGITKEGQWLITRANAEEIDSDNWCLRTDNQPAYLVGDSSLKGLLVNGKKVAIDCIFPIIHGNVGEDGKLQGLLELTDIPYVGSGVCASACSMDKAVTRLFADKIGLKQPKCVVLIKESYEKNKEESLKTIVEELVNFPMFSKPASTGSSIGITRIDNEESLKEGIELAFKYESKILIEEGIIGDEFKVAILGNKDLLIGDLCKISTNANVFNDYKTKYVTGTSIKEIPANIPNNVANEIKRQAIAIYCELECRGFSRVDFFVTKNNEIYFNEINTIPGFSAKSIFTLMFSKQFSYTELITKLIDLAEEEYKEKHQKSTDFMYEA